MLRVQNLTKFFDEVKAVNDVTFEVKRGEILGFLGPNGAGKTTTMKVITGYLAPTSGRVFIEDKDIAEYPLDGKKKVGYVPESFPIYEDMIVYDYLSYISDIRELPKTKRVDRIREVGVLCGLEAVIGREISQLSKGYRQRVGLAQALIHEPEILVLDEPTDGLDPNQKVEIRNIIKEIGKTRTIILSTHNLPEVQTMCDRVVIINDGKIIAEGTPVELEHKMSKNNLLHLAFELPVAEAADKLKSLPDVVAVKQVENADKLFELLIEYRKDSEIRRAVFNMAVSGGWPVMEMRKESASLEEIFQRLTQS